MAVRRICRIDVGGGHRGGARRRRGGSRFLVATGAGFRSRVTSAAARCTATASTGVACLGQPSLGQNESSSARGAAQVCGRVCVRWVPSYLESAARPAAGSYTAALCALGGGLYPLGSASQTRASSRLAARRDLENRQETKRGAFVLCVSSVLQHTLAKLSSRLGPDKAPNA